MIQRSLVSIAVAVSAVGLVSASRSGSPALADDFTATVLTVGLNTPWDLAWGPDGMIWVSERGGRISRVDPNNGLRTDAGVVPGVLESGEGGLMGIAFHPDFSGRPYLYAVHTYSSGRDGTRNKLVRMLWRKNVLGAPETLLDNIRGAGIHNGSRIAVGPDRMLYVTTGDAGSSDVAQDSASLNGKILRLTLEGQPAPGNPLRNAIWSLGHRNGQGLVFHPTMGVLYETEHGPGDNDEVNIIQRGRNYGWPNVHGMCDDGDAGGEREFCTRHHVVEPLTAWTPTVAISGADIYLSDSIPSFRNSLLATSLNGSSLWRMTLSSDGQRITQRVRLLQGTYGRLRDVLVAPNGDVYVCTSNRDGRGSARNDDDRIIRLRRR